MPEFRSTLKEKTKSYLIYIDMMTIKQDGLYRIVTLNSLMQLPYSTDTSNNNIIFQHKKKDISYTTTYFNQ